MELTKREKEIIIFSGIASAVYMAESAIPMPLPGVKLGLANSISLFLLYRDGLSFALYVFFIRLFATSLFTGSFLSPAFVLALSGGLSSLLVMYSAISFQKMIKNELLSVYGVSILGAVTHNVAQYAAVYILIFTEPGLIYYVSVLLVSGILSGLATGRIAQSLLKWKPKPA